MGQVGGRARHPDLKRQAQAFEKNTDTQLSMKEFANLEEQIAFEYPRVASVRESVLIADNRLPDTPIVYANDAFERMTKYPKEHILGRNCRFLQGPLTDRKVVAQVRKAVDEGRPLHVELLNYRADNVPFWNTFLMLPIHKHGKKSGKVEFFIAVQQDVSVLKGLCKEVDKWSAPEVCMWLEKRDLGFAVSRFLEARVEGGKLLMITDHDLSELGFETGERERVLAAIRDDFDKGLYRHIPATEKKAGERKRKFEPDVQSCTEYDVDSEDTFEASEHWGTSELGICNPTHVTIKCTYSTRMPIVFLLPCTVSAQSMLQQLTERVGRNYTVSFLDEDDDAHPLRTADDLQTALTLADNGTLRLELTDPQSGIAPDAAAALACVGAPVVYVDAFGLIVYANAAANTFLRTSSLDETAADCWFPPSPHHVAVHQLVGRVTILPVTRADGSIKKCRVQVALASLGLAVVTFYSIRA